MPSVTATEFQKRVGEFTEIARREPVTVVRHGRPSVVLLAAEDYDRLRRLEGRATQALRTVDLSDATMRALMEADLAHLPTD